MEILIVFFMIISTVVTILGLIGISAFASTMRTRIRLEKRRAFETERRREMKDSYEANTKTGY